MTNNISFKSRFRPVLSNEFARISSSVAKKNFVNSPWTINESVKAIKAVTTGIYDCSVLGITDGTKVFLMHICPTKPQNEDFEKIKEFIINNTENNDQPLQAALFGSQTYGRRSTKLFENLKNLMSELNIPCSFFKNCWEYFNVLYDSNKDEWCISCVPIERCLIDGKTNSEEILKKAFFKVELSPLDEYA